MNKIFDLIHLPNGHRYAVEEREDYKISPEEIYYDKYNNEIKIASTSGWGTWQVIIASDDKSLNLPLLPPIEEDVQKISDEFGDFWARNNGSYDNLKDEEEKEDFEEEKGKYSFGFFNGYKAAKAKQYTEEDIMKWYKYVKTHTVEEAFTHLKQSLNPLPKQVEVELYDFTEALEQPLAPWDDTSANAYMDDKLKRKRGQPKVDANNIVNVIKYI